MGEPEPSARQSSWVRRLDLWVPGLYAAISAGWIALSDLALASMSRSARTVAMGSVVKGWAFVAVTAVLLHLGLRRGLARQRSDFEQLARATRLLRDSDARKERLISMLSHELRNPLASLRQALWLLERAPPASGQAALATETMGRQLAHLTRMSDDLVDVTGMAHGKVELRRERLELAALVRAVLQDHGPALAARGLDLAAHLPALPLWLDGDPVRLGQVIGNVLWNAAKFTEAGGHVSVTLERGEGGRAVLRVADDGIGIPGEALARVFEPFAQVDDTLHRSRGGLGLGLAIVRSLVEQHGGTVHAASGGPGAGAEFTISLPLAPEAPALLDAPGRHPHPSGRHRVLVVEDNLDAAETLREVLLLWEHEVVVAHDGREGVEKARSFRPDVILCDIGLPVMDGYEVARAIRSDPELASTFLVAVTGYASDEDARRAAGAGFDRHLGKPVPVEVIEELLAAAPAGG